LFFWSDVIVSAYCEVGVKVKTIGSCLTMATTCGIGEEVRRELGLVDGSGGGNGERGTYIDLDKMRTVGYASVDYNAILDTLEREIPKYDFNFLKAPNPPGWVSKCGELGELMREGLCVTVYRRDFHAYFVHMIDNVRHVRGWSNNRLPCDERRAIAAITAQLWNVVDDPTCTGGSTGTCIDVDARELFCSFHAILMKHARVAEQLRKQLVPCSR
jgi:hypothetical protein